MKKNIREENIPPFFIYLIESFMFLYEDLNRFINSGIYHNFLRDP